MRQVMALLAGHTARRRAEIARALADMGDVVVEGEAVQVSGRGLRARWMRDLALREAGRGGI